MAVDHVKQAQNPALIQSCINAPDVSFEMHNFFLNKHIPLPSFGMRDIRTAQLTGRACSPSLFTIEQLLNHRPILSDLEIRSEQLVRTHKSLIAISIVALGILLPWGLLAGLTLRVAFTAIVAFGVVGAAFKVLHQDIHSNHERKAALQTFQKNSELFTQKIIGNGIVHEMLVNRENYLKLCLEEKGSFKQHWAELNTLYTYLEAPAQELLRQEAKTVYQKVMTERKERERLQTAS